MQLVDDYYQVLFSEFVMQTADDYYTWSSV